MEISEARARLLIALESIVGNECYNANIQNWYDFEYQDSGREFRYPITFNTEDGTALKEKYVDSNLQPSIVRTGRYKFGANELHIMSALNKVLSYLEKNHSLRIEA